MDLSFLVEVYFVKKFREQSFIFKYEEYLRQIIIEINSTKKSIIIQGK